MQKGERSFIMKRFKLLSDSQLQNINGGYSEMRQVRNLILKVYKKIFD